MAIFKIEIHVPNHHFGYPAVSFRDVSVSIQIAHGYMHGLHCTHNPIILSIDSGLSLARIAKSCKMLQSRLRVVLVGNVKEGRIPVRRQKVAWKR